MQVIDKKKLSYLQLSYLLLWLAVIHIKFYLVQIVLEYRHASIDVFCVLYHVISTISVHTGFELVKIWVLDALP